MLIFVFLFFNDTFAGYDIKTIKEANVAIMDREDTINELEKEKQDKETKAEIKTLQKEIDEIENEKIELIQKYNPKTIQETIDVIVEVELMIAGFQEEKLDKKGEEKIDTLSEKLAAFKELKNELTVEKATNEENKTIEQAKTVEQEVNNNFDDEESKSSISVFIDSGMAAAAITAFAIMLTTFVSVFYKKKIVDSSNNKK